MTQPEQSDEEEPSSLEEDPFDDEDSWQPFLQPCRKRARAKTVEKSAEEEEEDEEDEDDDEEVESFPYPVVTKIVRNFGEHGIYWGLIEKHYPDDTNLCLAGSFHRWGQRGS